MESIDIINHLKSNLVNHFIMLSNYIKNNAEVSNEKSRKIMTQIMDEYLTQTLTERNLNNLNVNNHNNLAFLWKIDRIRRKIKDAKSGYQLNNDSPPFKTSEFGYNLQSTISLNGNGPAKGSHVSLFISILNGPYDEILTWPFTTKIEITLFRPFINNEQFDDDCVLENADSKISKEIYNDKDSFKCIIKPFVCEQNMIFLRKPTMVNNPSFGLVFFIEHEELENFITTDNCIYIGYSIIN